MRFRFPRGSQASGAPLHDVPGAVLLPLPQDTWPAPASGFSFNSRLQPRGLPTTWHIEYGPTTSYGSTTATRQLPGKLAAVYQESFASAVSGWAAGLDNAQLSYQSSEGGFVRCAISGGNDNNHTDAVGVINLGPYFFPGRTDYSGGGYKPSLNLGGGKPDFRGASITVDVRGNSFVPNGVNVCPWAQWHLDATDIYGVPMGSLDEAPNWAFTSQSFNATLALSGWQSLAYTIRNRVDLWTFGSHNSSDGRLDYVYGELDTGLSRLDLDHFLFQFVGVDTGTPPTGTVDVRNLRLIYRDNSACSAANGGTLVSSPAGGTDASVLTDGHRNTAGHTWQSGASPSYPQDFVFSFANAVGLESVVVTNDPSNPSEDVELFTSPDGVAWTSQGTLTLAATHAEGPNFLYKKWSTDDGSSYTTLATGVTHIRVRILSAYGARAGLGSIEAFGTGVVYGTDNAYYDINADLYLPAGTWHARVVATNSVGTSYGPDLAVTVPGATFAPHLRTDCEAWWDTRHVIGGATPNRIYNQSTAHPSIRRDLLVAQGTASMATAAAYGSADAITFPGDASFDSPLWDAAVTQPCRIYYVADWDVFGGKVLFSPAPTSTGSVVVKDDGGSGVTGDAGTALSGGSTAASPHVACVVFNGASSAIYIDDPTTPVASGNAGTDGFTAARLGCNAVSAAFFSGKWTALGVFAGAGDVTERAEIMNGLAARYGL